MGKTKPLHLTQGDAFNLWSALGMAAYQTKSKTYLDLEEKLRSHLNTQYKMSIKNKEVGSK